jgi:hypothetical protein
MEANLDSIRSSRETLNTHKGKVAVVTEQRLQGVFVGFEEARKTASKFRVAFTFRVDEKPATRVVELGPEMEV